MTVRFSLSAGLGLAALVAGLECFLRFASEEWLKAGSLALLAGGCLLLGLRSWAKPEILGKLVIALFFGCYLAAAAARYQGLVKDAYPLDGLRVLRLGFAGFLAVVLPVAALGGVVALWRIVRRRLRKDALPARGNEIHDEV